MLGGSTGLNLMAWNRASKIEYDAWQSFSGPGGWNWSNILPFMRKSEAVNKNLSNPFPGITPAEEKLAEAEYLISDGFTGNVKVSIRSKRSFHKKLRVSYSHHLMFCTRTLFSLSWRL